MYVVFMNQYVYLCRNKSIYNLSNGFSGMSGGVLKLNGSMDCFTSTHYNTRDVRASDLNDGSMDVVDLEVYKVSGLLIFLIHLQIIMYFVN